MQTKDNSEALYGDDAMDVAGKIEPAANEVPRYLRPAPRLIPNGDLILLRRLEPDEKTEGGIILPTCLENDFFRAEVLAMGKGHWDMTAFVPGADCKEGDIVLVQDEPKNQDPRQPIHKHLIPVTPDDKQFVLSPGRYIYAIELPPLEEHPCRKCEDDCNTKYEEPCSVLSACDDGGQDV